MDKEYDDLYRTVTELQFKFHDYSTGANHPETLRLQAGIHRLVEDVKVKKNPRSLEDQAKILLEQIHELHSSPEPVMEYTHLEDMHHRVEDIRQELRKFSNY